MNAPSPLTRTPEVDIIRAQTEATRARADAGKAIVATIVRGVLPLGVYGIAVGATAIVMERAAPSLHLAGLLIIWICATVFSTVSILSGLLERRPVNLRRLLGDDSIQLEPQEAKKLRNSYQE